MCPNLFDLLDKDSYNYETLYRNFEAEIHQYKDIVNLCGLSLGGILALDYAKRCPDRINSLILIGVPYKIPKLLFNLQILAFKFMPKSSFKKLGLTKDAFISLLESMKDLKIDTNMEKINCKTLIICGEKDKFNRGSSKLFHEKMENSELRIIRKAGHEVNIDSPENLAQMILDFWKR